MLVLPCALRQLALVARLFLRTAGRAAAWRTLPLYFAIGIAALVLFGGNGMDASTVTRDAEARPSFRLALLASWVLVTLPTARIWLGTPETFFVRSLPVSRHGVVAVLGAGTCAIHLPWAALWLRGAGVLGALWAVASAVLLQTLLVAGLRRWHDLAALALGVAAVCAGPGRVSSGAAIGLAATALAVWSLEVAWSRAAERSSNGRGWVSSRGPLLAEMTALAVTLGRRHSPVLFRAALFGLGAAWLAIAGIAHGAADELGALPLCLLLWVSAATLGAAAIAGPVLRAERSLAWIGQVCGAPPRVALAPALLLGAFGAIGGAGFAAIVTAASGLGGMGGAALAAASLSAGAATAMIACGVARRALRGDGRDAGRVLLAHMGSLSAWIAGIVMLGARALPVMALISFLLLLSERRAWQRGALACST